MINKILIIFLFIVSWSANNLDNSITRFIDKEIKTETINFQLSSESNYASFDYLYSFDANNFVKIKYKIPYLNTIYSIYKNKIIYSGSNGQCYLANIDTKYVYPIDITGSGRAHSIKVDENSLYISYDDAVFKMNLDTDAIEKIDLNDYKKNISTLIGGDFTSFSHYDSNGIYFLTNKTDDIADRRFICLDTRGKVKFNLEKHAGGIVRDTFIFYEDYDYMHAQKLDKYGKLLKKFSHENFIKDYTPDRCDEIYFMASKSNLYVFLEGKGLFYLDNTHMKKEVYSNRIDDGDMVQVFDNGVVFILEDTLHIKILDGLDYTFDIQRFIENKIILSYFYGDTFTNKNARNHIDYNHNGKIKKDNFFFFLLGNPVKDLYELWAVSPLSKEKIKIDEIHSTKSLKFTVNDYWENEVFIDNNIIFYYNYTY